MRVPLLAAILLLTTLAGCLQDEQGQDEGPVQDPDWAVRAIYGDVDPAAVDHLVDHDHSDLSLHQNRSTPNFEVVGWNPLVSEYHGGPSGTYYCGDRSGDVEGRTYAVVHSFATDVALMVLDVTDHADIQLVGELVLPMAFVYDVAILEDASYAALVVNPDSTVDGPATVQGLFAGATWRTPCGETPVPIRETVDNTPFQYATVLVDLTDKASPEVADFAPHLARNMHSVSAATIDGQRFFVSSGLMDSCVRALPPEVRDPVCNTLPRFGNLLSFFEFTTVEDTAAGARLVPYGLYSGGNFGNFDPDIASLANGHVDATIQKHPLTGDTIAYLAHWDGGFIIVRLNGLGDIEHLATWGEASDATTGKDFFGNVHSAVPLDERNGRHFTLMGQEVVGPPEGRSTGQIVLLDTTDPAAPEPVARWTLPVQIDQWPGLLFSTHYPVMQGDTLFVPLYHGGVWAADASQDQWPELPSIGVFVPDRAPPSEPVAKSPSPEILETLVLDDETLLVFDGNSGAYSVRFTGAHEDVPTAAPWTQDAWIGQE